MIQPHAITNYSRTEFELQEFLLFCVCVAGKSSEQQSVKLDKFITNAKRIPNIAECDPFTIIRFLSFEGTRAGLEEVKMGQYTRIVRAFLAIAHSGLDLRTCTVADLENIPGVGLKTSRFFLTHSRANQEYGILDTHILTHMRNDLGIATPKTTPTSPAKYYALEAKLLEVVRASGKSYAEYDLEVWSKRVLDKKNKAAKVVA